MEYQKFEHTLIVRLDRGEEIVDCLLDLARREHITLASVNGLGAVNQVTAGVFSPVTKQYRSHEFQGDFEIICLHGTLTTRRPALRPLPHQHRRRRVPGLGRASEPRRDQRHLRAGGHGPGRSGRA